MRQLWHRVISEDKPNCSAIIHAIQDDHGILITSATISIPKTYKGEETARAGLKRNGFSFEEIILELEQQFEILELENEET